MHINHIKSMELDTWLCWYISRTDSRSQDLKIKDREAVVKGIGRPPAYAPEKQ
jgi:hypothetical protein